LKKELNRLSPNLRQIGIEVRFGKRTNKGIPVELEQVQKSSSLSTLSTQPLKTKDLCSDDARDDGSDAAARSARSDDDSLSSSPSSPASSPGKSFVINGGDDSDDSDDKNQSILEEVERL
jgi:hypothetical protein